MRVSSQPIILRHFNKKLYTEATKNEYDPTKKELKKYIIQYMKIIFFLF